MEIRPSTEADLPRMLEIYEHARAFMARHGNPLQWGPTRWPPESLLRSDIASGRSFVCTGGGRILATFFYDQGENCEPCYQNIEEGAWPSQGPYGVVHRIASDGSVRGTGSFCITWAHTRCGTLRMDTHPDNHVMQNLLARLGFQRCGIIHVEEDNYPRYAYEWREE